MKKFTKDDLKTGMIIETKKRSKYLVLRGNLPFMHYDTQNMMFMNIDGFLVGDSYNSALEIIKGQKEFDVIKIYEPPLSSMEEIFMNCNKGNLIWERPIDWSKVPIDTKVLVRDENNSRWRKRHFAKYENGKIYTFSCGTTSWSVNESVAWGDYNDYETWKYVQLAEENKE